MVVFPEKTLALAFDIDQGSRAGFRRDAHIVVRVFLLSLKLIPAFGSWKNQKRTNNISFPLWLFERLSFLDYIHNIGGIEGEALVQRLSKGQLDASSLLPKVGSTLSQPGRLAKRAPTEQPKPDQTARRHHYHKEKGYAPREHQLWG